MEKLNDGLAGRGFASNLRWVLSVGYYFAAIGVLHSKSLYLWSIFRGIRSTRCMLKANAKAGRKTPRKANFADAVRFLLYSSQAASSWKSRGVFSTVTLTETTTLPLSSESSQHAGHVLPLIPCVLCAFRIFCETTDFFFLQHWFSWFYLKIHQNKSKLFFCIFL